VEGESRPSFDSWLAISVHLYRIQNRRHWPHLLLSYVDKAVTLGSDEVPDKERSLRDVVSVRLSEDKSAL
jgi:hypothetical protein